MTWTQEIRKKMYRRIVSEIGPHDSWDAKIRPSAKRPQYDQLLVTLAKEFTQETGEPCKVTAIQQQINYATTTERILGDQSIIRNFIMNKAAALDAGFIASRSLPTRVTFDFSN